LKRWIAVALAVVLSAGVVATVRVMAQSSEDDTRVLVRFKKGITRAERDEAVSEKKAEKAGEIYADSDVWVVSSKEGKKDKKLAADFAKDKRVVYAEPDIELHLTLANPNDALFTEEYSHQRINSLAGWTLYPGVYSSSGGPTIAVVDTGIDTNHPDLVGHIDTAKSRCFGFLCVLTGYEDDNGHGTHTAGTAGAAANNGVGIAGVAFNTKIMALKVCNAAGTCSTSDVASAVNYARTNGAKVVSMSLGGGGTATLQTAVTNAWNAGLVLVAAAGNDGNATLNYPAAYQEVISVAATDASDRRASFSNANGDVELAAPGVSVVAPYNDGGYRYLSGTSMATPHVAGLAALLFGQHPTWTNAAVRNQMDQCSDDLGALGRDTSFGFGRINLGRALGVC
jgi:thermitase